MIEYMSTVILTGCGPEVCATSKTTKQRLRQQAEEDGGHLRIERGYISPYCNSMGKLSKTHRERERDRGMCMERVSL